MKKFVEFDDNGDGVLTFDEFEVLINNLGKLSFMFGCSNTLEKTMERDRISEIFNETLEMDEHSTGN